MTVERPEKSRPVAIRAERLQRGIHESGADTGSPRGEIDCDCIEFAELRIDRVTTWADACEADDPDTADGDPPTIWRRPREILCPVVQPVGICCDGRHDVFEDLFPGVDVDADDFAA